MPYVKYNLPRILRDVCNLMTRGAKLYDLTYIIHIMYHGIKFGC